MAKTALDQVIRENTISARFGLLKMRQTNPRIVSPADGPVYNADPGQLLPTDGVGSSFWKLYRGVVDGNNRSLETSTAPLVSPDGANPNTTIQTILAQAVLLVVGADAGRQRLVRRRRRAVGAPAR